MRIYLDVSCLNRPFDDQAAIRVHLETEAIRWILGQTFRGGWELVASEMVELEIAANPDPERRERVRLLLPETRNLLRLTEAVLARGVELEEFGFKTADAIHIAAAESLRSDAFLSCDDRLVRRAQRYRSRLLVPVKNPLSWIREQGHDLDV